MVTQMAFVPMVSVGRFCTFSFDSVNRSRIQGPQAFSWDIGGNRSKPSGSSSCQRLLVREVVVSALHAESNVLTANRLRPRASAAEDRRFALPHQRVTDGARFAPREAWKPSPKL
jgi:hypothetical protein